MGKAGLAVGLAAAVGLSFGSWKWWQGKSAGRERGLRWTEVSKGTIEDAVEANGSVVPLQRVSIQAPISGRIEQLLVDEGTKVKAGQIIAWMSSSDRAAILDAARAQGPVELKRWEDAYKPTPIVAPLSGIVILRNVVTGETVSPSSVIYAMADELIVLAQVDESDIGRVKTGQSARIVLDAYPSEKVQGKVFDILYEGKNVSNVITYGVKVKPLQVPAFFRSQMTANVSFIVGRKEDALLLPASAVSDAPGGGRQVMVPGAEGKPEPKAVKTGLELGDKIEIVSGLEEGDKVLASRGRYRPQEGPQSSPLGFGGSGRPGGGSQGEAPRRRNRQGSGGN
ncbi:MAG: efflux RND transporter periplasmic adaptor subunit [Elusimicrobia bacterium]|nr:efflux RND transporter periplasmic adaptor subunit [Elusimicrobiota bacterium]